MNYQQKYQNSLKKFHIAKATLLKLSKHGYEKYFSDKEFVYLENLVDDILNEISQAERIIRYDLHRASRYLDSACDIFLEFSENITSKGISLEIIDYKFSESLASETVVHSKLDFNDPGLVDS